MNRIAGSAYDFRFKHSNTQMKSEMSRFIEEWGIEPKEIYTGYQIHGDTIRYADGKNGEKSDYGKTFKDTDGLITDQPGIALFIKFADCTPVVFYDPVKKVQASVHSGWRGTVSMISLKALQKMTEEFGCRKQDIKVYVGPSIDQRNYEVGSEVYNTFADFKNRDDYFKRSGEKYLLSMTGANTSILKEAGIPEHNIQVEYTSTYSCPRLHSARREGKRYGLNGMMTIIPET